jgi:hypothetical protein
VDRSGAWRGTSGRCHCMGPVLKFSLRFTFPRRALLSPWPARSLQLYQRRSSVVVEERVISRTTSRRLKASGCANRISGSSAQFPGVGVGVMSSEGEVVVGMGRRPGSRAVVLLLARRCRLRNFAKCFVYSSFFFVAPIIGARARSRRSGSIQGPSSALMPTHAVTLA